MRTNAPAIPLDATPDALGNRYDAVAAEKAVAFFPRHLRFTKDRWAGKPFVLAGWEADNIIRPLFGWKRADGTRRYRRAVVFLPRKNGKTEIAAGVGLLMLIGDGKRTFGPEIYTIAKDKDQARLSFDKASLMVASSPDLGSHLQVFRTSIFCAELQGIMKPLSGNPEGKHGLNASGLIGDEVHEWPDGRLYTTVHQSMAAREQPVEFLISTAGIRNKGYGWDLWQEAEAILDGTRPQDDTLVVIYAAAPDADWSDEATWEDANPNLDVSVSRDYLRAECDKARSNPRLENDFRRYHLNQWTEQAIRWISLDKWDACAVRLVEDESTLVGRNCVVGVDLASTADIAAVVLLFPPETPDGTFDLICRFFVPEDRIVERARRDRVPYDVWARKGLLIATPGNVTDYEYILTTIENDGARFDLALLGTDRWNSSHFTTRLADRGFPAERIVAVGQGYTSMSEPAKMLERLILSRRLDHAGHPVLRWMAGNVAITQDSAGNIKPAKDKSSEKIDGISALCDALFCHLNHTPDAASVYEERGIVELDLT